jgi:hypothetical protein
MLYLGMAGTSCMMGEAVGITEYGWTGRMGSDTIDDDTIIGWDTSGISGVPSGVKSVGLELFPGSLLFFLVHIFKQGGGTYCLS